MRREVSLSAYPRIHFGLIDLGGTTPRSYGGAGAAFCGRPIHVTATNSDQFTISGEFYPHLRRKVLPVIDRADAEGLPTGAAVVISDVLPAHVGFGSGTATVLATLTAVARLHRWPLAARDLVRLSGRGRTSGVGCRTFFDGGFIADAGQPGHPLDGRYRPSSDPHNRNASVALGSWPMPEEWRITLITTEVRPTVPAMAESAFFHTNTPTSDADVLRQLALLYHGMLPALIEADLPAFSAFLTDYQRRGFKRAEIDAQPGAVRQLLVAAWDLGLAAGLTSLGPTVFVIHERAADVCELGLDLSGYTTTGPYEFRNRGASCEVHEE